MDAQRIALENMARSLYTVSMDGVARVKGVYGEIYTIQAPATKESHTFAITGSANYVPAFVEKSEAGWRFQRIDGRNTGTLPGR